VGLLLSLLLPLTIILFQEIESLTAFFLMQIGRQGRGQSYTSNFGVFELYSQSSHIGAGWSAARLQLTVLTQSQITIHQLQPTDNRTKGEEVVKFEITGKSVKPMKHGNF
jgi:hypothetical protein